MTTRPAQPPRSPPTTAAISLTLSRLFRSKIWAYDRAMVGVGVTDGVADSLRVADGLPENDGDFVHDTEMEGVAVTVAVADGVAVTEAPEDGVPEALGLGVGEREVDAPDDGDCDAPLLFDADALAEGGVMNVYVLVGDGDGVADDEDPCDTLGVHGYMSYGYTDGTVTSNPQPICPAEFSPQHRTPPLSPINTHVCE